MIRRHLRAWAWSFPALAAALSFSAGPPYATMLSGGRELLLYNLSQLILAPYAAYFMLALGRAALPAAPAAPGSRLQSADSELICFFGGAGVLAVLGFALGAAGLLTPWVTIPLFVLVIHLELLRAPLSLEGPARWAGALDLRGQGSARAVGLVVRGLVCLMTLSMLLEKAIVVDLNQNDSLQLYFAYFADIRPRHGIWLDPSAPIIFSFLLGRGHGAHLFFTSFAGQFFIQCLSVVYWIATALIVRRVAALIADGVGALSAWPTARSLLPDAAMMLALASLLARRDAGKFHPEVGAFLMFLSWAGPLALLADERQARWLGIMLLPAAIALPLAVPQAQAAAAAILVFSAAACRTKGAARPRIHARLILAGCAAAAFSLLLNQLYLGLAEVNPYQLFLSFANALRLERWSSPELIVYVSSSQGFAYLNGPREVLASFFDLVVKLAWPAAAFPALLGIPALLVSRLKRPIFDEDVSRFIGVFFAFFLTAALLIALTGHGSLKRMMAYLDEYAAIVFVLGFALAGATWSGVKRAKRLEAPFSALIAAAAIALSMNGVLNGRETWTARVKDLARSGLYFSGTRGLIHVSDKMPGHYDNARRFGFCDVLSRIIPKGESALPLNSIFNIVPACAYSPLLPKGMVQDTLQYSFAPEFGTALLGGAEEAFASLKRRHVDYFIIERGDIHLWGPGVGPHFSGAALRASFDLFYEDDRLIVLTWRGRGAMPLSAALAAEIDALRESARASAPQYFEGLARLREWSAARAAPR